MRALTFVGVLATLCGLAPLASAQNYRDTTGDAINPEKAINQSRNNAHIQLGEENFGAQRSYRAGSLAPSAAAAAPAQMGQQNRADQWRFRFHNSEWWYYMPDKSWRVWNGSHWTEPMARAGSMQNQDNAGQQQPHQSGYRGAQGINAQPAQQAPAASTQAGPQAATKTGGGQAPQGNQPNAASPAKPNAKTPAGSNQ